MINDKTIVLCYNLSYGIMMLSIPKMHFYSMESAIEQLYSRIS